MTWMKKDGLLPSGMTELTSPPDGAGEIRPRSFFRLLETAYEKAKKKSGLASERFYSIAGYRIKINLVNSSLVPIMTKPMDQLEVAPSPTVDFEISSWDINASGSVFDTLPGDDLPNHHWTYRGRRFEAMP